ncbi:MFS transporter [Oceanobacillus neutriphilus]|uniref:MFS transporter n=2 Tax=Oceanobacillus neutriphilus TaxID=531815 RepID=A0ABQ2NMF2_9BACI|nr:MFS transporter [Oceanobacillus neutriphilus]
MYQAALPFLVFHINGGAAELSLANTFYIAPQAIVLIFGGVFTDRWNRKYTLVITDLIKTLSVFLIFLLLLFGELKMFHVYGLTASLGIVSTFSRPTTRGIIPQLVRKDQLVNANSLRAISRQVSQMLAPVAGGFLISAVGIFVVFGINTFTFLFSALFISTIHLYHKTAKTSDEKDNKQSYWKDLADGFKTVKSINWLFIGILVSSINNIFVASFDVIALPIYIRETFQTAELSGAEVYGFTLSSMAIGALLSAFWMGRQKNLPSRGILYYTLIGFTGIAVFLLTLSHSIIITLFITTIIGFLMTTFIIVWESLLQDLIDNDKLGRITSIDMFGGLVLLPVGYWIFGFLIEATNAALVIKITGLGIILMAGIPMLFSSVRKLK